MTGQDRFRTGTPVPLGVAVLGGPGRRHGLAACSKGSRSSWDAPFMLALAVAEIALLTLRPSDR